jgi:hypothetical protein
LPRFRRYVEVCVELVEKAWGETVFVAAEVEYGDLFIVGQANSHA